MHLCECGDDALECGIPAQCRHRIGIRDVNHESGNDVFFLFLKDDAALHKSLNNLIYDVGFIDFPVR